MQHLESKNRRLFFSNDLDKKSHFSAVNKIKQYLGFVWMVLSVVLVLFMLYQAYIKVDAAAAGISKTNTLLQWVIILLVFLPICAGLFIFGKYALAKEYDRMDNQ